MSEAPTFRCGHPRTPENSRKRAARVICRACDNAYHKDYMRSRTARLTPQERYDDSRRRYLPVQMENLRRKLAACENEAERTGRFDLLEPHA